MHELPPRFRPAPLRELVRDLVPREIRPSLFRLLFLTHGNPCVRHEHVGVADDVFGGFGDFELSRSCGGVVAVRSLDDVEDASRDLVAFRRRDADVDTEFPGADGEIEEDLLREEVACQWDRPVSQEFLGERGKVTVICVTDPRQLQSLQTQPWRGRSARRGR